MSETSKNTLPISVPKSRSSSIVEHIQRQNTANIGSVATASCWTSFFSLYSFARLRHRCCRKRKWKEWEKNVYDYGLSLKLMNPETLNEYTIDMFFERGVEFSWSLGILLATFWWPFTFLGWSLSNCVLFFLRLYRVNVNGKKYQQNWKAIINYRIQHTVIGTTDDSLRDTDEHTIERFKEQETQIVHSTTAIFQFLQSIMSFPVAIFLIIAIIPFTVSSTNPTPSSSGGGTEKLIAIISILEPYILSCLLLPPVTAMVTEIGILFIGSLWAAKRIRNGLRHRAIVAALANDTSTNESSTVSRITQPSNSSLSYPSYWRTVKMLYSAYVSRILALRFYTHFLAVQCFVLYCLFRSPGTLTGKVLTNLFFILNGIVICIIALASIAIFIVWFRAQKIFLRQSWEHEILMEEENEILLRRQQQEERNDSNNHSSRSSNIAVSNPMHAYNNRTDPSSFTVVPTGVQTRNHHTHSRSPFTFSSSSNTVPSIVIRPQIVRERTTLHLNTIRKNNSLLCSYWFMGILLTSLCTLLWIELYRMIYEPFITRFDINDIITLLLAYDKQNGTSSSSGGTLSRLIYPSTKIIGYYIGIQLGSMVGLVLLARTIQDIWDSEDTFSRWITRNTLMNNEQYQRLTKIEEDNQRGLRIPLYLEKINDGKYHRTSEDASIIEYGIQIIPNPIHELRTILDGSRLRSLESRLTNGKGIERVAEESKRVPVTTITKVTNEPEITTIISLTSLVPNAQGLTANIPTILHGNENAVSVKLPFTPSLESSFEGNDIVHHPQPHHHHHHRSQSSYDHGSCPPDIPVVASVVHPPPTVITVTDEEYANSSSPLTTTPVHNPPTDNSLRSRITTVSPRPRLFLSKVRSPSTFHYRRGTTHTTVSASSSSTSSVTNPSGSLNDTTIVLPIANDSTENQVLSTTVASSSSSSSVLHSPTFSTSASYTSRIQHRGTCFICYERPADTVFMECGHSGVCYTCAEIIYKGRTIDIDTFSVHNHRHRHHHPYQPYPYGNSYGSRTSYYDSDTEGIPPSLLYASSHNNNGNNNNSTTDPSSLPTNDEGSSSPTNTTDGTAVTTLLPLRNGGSRICPICRGPVSQILHIGPDIRTVDGKILTIVLPRQYWERSQNNKLT